MHTSPLPRWRPGGVAHLLPMHTQIKNFSEKQYPDYAAVLKQRLLHAEFLLAATSDSGIEAIWRLSPNKLVTITFHPVIGTRVIGSHGCEREFRELSHYAMDEIVFSVKCDSEFTHYRLPEKFCQEHMAIYPHTEIGALLSRISTWAQNSPAKCDEFIRFLTL